MYDAIIIGSGPAGISAAIYLKRSNLNVLVLTTSSSALKSAKRIDNYYGSFNKTGLDIYNEGITQAQMLKIPLIEEEVLNIETNYENNPTYSVKTKNNIYMSKSIILATGTKRLMPGIANLPSCNFHNISFCAICDGFFYRNEDIYILGYNDYCLEEAEVLKKVAHSVTILTNGLNPTFCVPSDILVDDRKIKSFRGNKVLEEIEFEDEIKKVPGLFIAWDSPGGVEFSKKLGLDIDNNTIVVNEKMETNMPYFYACGDITGSPYQVAKAVYEGMTAALNLVKKIKG